ATDDRVALAGAELGLGDLLRVSGRATEAEETFRLAAGLLEPLVAAGAVEPRQKLAAAHDNLGLVLREVGRVEEAAASYRRRSAPRGVAAPGTPGRRGTPPPGAQGRMGEGLQQPRPPPRRGGAGEGVGSGPPTSSGPPAAAERRLPRPAGLPPFARPRDAQPG